MAVKSGKSTNNQAVLLPVLGVFISMFICSGMLLFVLSLVVYYLNISSDIAQNCIYAIYAISAFMGGLIIGKIRRGKLFFWGIVAGAGYFALLLLISLISNGGAFTSPARIPVILVLCVIPAIVGTFFCKI